MIKRRKARTDRNHLVYQLSVCNLQYIGVTVVVNSSPKRSLHRRFQKHVQRALAEGTNWKLSKAIRKYGPEEFTVQALEIIRGKTEAHRRERELIKKHNPKLNTDVR